MPHGLGMEYGTSDARGSGKARILLVDDNEFVRKGILRLLNSQNDLVCCGEARTITEASRLLSESKPDLILLHLQVKDVPVLDFIEFLKLQASNLVILVLSQGDDVAEVERALRAGAHGYVLSQEAPQEILNAIRSLLLGKMYISQEIASRMFPRLLNIRSFGLMNPKPPPQS